MLWIEEQYISRIEASCDAVFANFEGSRHGEFWLMVGYYRAIENCLELGRLLGFSNVTTLTPEEHDEMIGFLSQLTHCIAITLMTCNDKEHMEKFTGDSFRDLTRIARINDLMWSELFVANKQALLDQMDMFADKFNELRTMLEKEDIDGMRKMMRHSTERRALFDKK